MESIYSRNFNSLSRSYAFRKKEHSRFMDSKPSSIEGISAPVMSFTARKYSSPSVAASLSSPRLIQSVTPRSQSMDRDHNRTNSLEKTPDTNRRSSICFDDVLNSKRSSSTTSLNDFLAPRPRGSSGCRDSLHGRVREENSINGSMRSTRGDMTSSSSSFDRSQAYKKDLSMASTCKRYQSLDLPGKHTYDPYSYSWKGSLTNIGGEDAILPIQRGLERVNEALQKHAGFSNGSFTSSPSAKSRVRGRLAHPFNEACDVRKELSANQESDERAEARLAQKRAARAEAREMRLKELEKTQQEENNEEEQQYAANSFTPETATRSSARSSVNRSSLVNSNSYSRSSDGSSDEALPSSAREIKSELKEVEEKFRKAMISNAQLDNEKSTLTYEVEFIKDKFTELEELHVQLNKEHRKKCSENEQLRKLSNKLQEEVKMVRTVIQERDELIQEYGLVVIGEEESREEYPPNVEEEMNDDTINNLSPRKIAVKKALLSQEAAELLSKGATSGSLDVRLKKYAEEKHELEDEVRRLRMELEEELHRRHKENGLDNEKQKEASKSLNDYKLRVQKSEAEVSTLQATVARLESLVTRYKSTSEELEKSEEELKVEKRKLMRELRDAQNRLEELEVTSSHLQKRFEKLKNARSNLLKDISQDPA